MKVLLATDGSDNSAGAAKFLSNFRFSSDDEITVLHVISDIPFKEDAEAYLDNLQNIKEEIASSILDDTVSSLGISGARISTAIMDGYPSKQIINAASVSGADLIVMGARGLKGIKPLLIGSVTRSTAINSPKPVLVIKPPQTDRKDRLKILYATDGSEYANLTAELLSSMPFPPHSELTVLYVLMTAHMDIPERFHIEIDDRIKAIVAEMREVEFVKAETIIKNARKILEKSFTNISEITRIGDPSEEILGAANEMNADIIALGSSGMSGIKGMLGSISRSVLGHSDCSVLIGK